jgi:hypothetical protein
MVENRDIIIENDVSTNRLNPDVLTTNLNVSPNRNSSSMNEVSSYARPALSQRFKDEIDFLAHNQ